MSRIGKATITVPAGVDVTVAQAASRSRVPRGARSSRSLATSQSLRRGDTLTCERPNDENKTKAMHGLTRSLVNNMVIGVTEGFTKELRFVGVGYRAERRAKTFV